MAYESKLPTYVLEGESLWKVSKDDVEKKVKRKKGMLLKYLNSDKIGIMVSTKPGQSRFEKARKFLSELKDKNGYIFIANNLDNSEFENFDIDCWVNTACPRMDLVDGPIINLSDLINN